MLSTIDLRGQVPTTTQLRRSLPRGGTDISSVIPTVAPIIDAVKTGGAGAALEFGERFDRVRPASVRVPDEVIDRAVGSLEPDVRAAITEAITRTRKVHRRARWPLRAGWASRLPILGDHERSTGARSWRAVVGGHQPAARRLRWLAAPHHLGSVPDAGRR